MLETTQSTFPSAAGAAGLFNSNWKRILFFFHKRVLLSNVEETLSAAAGHESNSVRPWAAPNTRFSERKPTHYAWSSLIAGSATSGKLSKFGERWTSYQSLIRHSWSFNLYEKL